MKKPSDQAAGLVSVDDVEAGFDSAGFDSPDFDSVDFEPAESDFVSVFFSSVDASGLAGLPFPLP
jgi:hypothetical protein